MKKHIYKNETAREIAFPLGGIGTGCISLAGNGQLIDPEIFNRPNKGQHMGYSHFAIKASNGDELISQKVLQGDFLKSYCGENNRPQFNCYGFGPDKASLAGMPHFETCEFIGEFPFAQINFKDSQFPAEIEMTAFNPFIPNNEDDSSIPAGFFEFNIKNTSDKAIDYSLSFSQANLYAKGSSLNKFSKDNKISSIFMTNNKEKDDYNYGDICIATDCEDVSYQEYWFRGKWFDSLTTFWQEFSEKKTLTNRNYDEKNIKLEGKDISSLVAHVSIGANESKKIKFILAWNCPNFRKYWDSFRIREESEIAPIWKNYYAVLFENSFKSAKYALENYDRLYNQTLLFKETLFNSSLPEVAIDAISANLSTIKSPTCIRLEDGSLYGFEGCHNTTGSCDGTCTHVWSYSYSIPFLFPKLERGMRTNEYKYSLNDDGGMAFRISIPLGSPRSDFRPCVDGQFGTVMRVLREFKISGDVEWLKSIWNEVKQSIEFAWSPDNIDKWDLNKDGLMEGRQHHTLDMELFGHNAWLSGMYLGGLKAGIELAKILGDTDAQQEYTSIFEKGKPRLNELFNGEYFSQKLDIKDKTILDRYSQGVSIHGQDVYNTYWHNEKNEIMYQISDGCELDQVLAQWHANLIGLGEIFDKEKTKTALSNIYKYNYVENMRNHINPCRIYSLNNEGGLIICTWQKGREKGAISLPYGEETQNGYEYAAAIQMIQSGLIEEGMTCVKAVRDRYTGEYRNPWNEFECGSHYARSMATYSLLLTYSGFIYDNYNNIFGFKPLIETENFQSFWSLEGAWGNVSYEQNKVKIDILYGKLTVQKLQMNTKKAVSKIIIDGNYVDFNLNENEIILNKKISVNNSIELFY